jgi:hypothetical protein
MQRWAVMSLIVLYNFIRSDSIYFGKESGKEDF